MDIWQETLIQSLLSANSEDALFAELLQAAKDIGFEFCAYGIRAPLPISSPKVHIINNYPQKWQQQYLQQNYLACDPTVAHAIRSNARFLWEESTFVSCRSFWEEARSNGLCFGLAQPCRGAKNVVGLLTLARGNDVISPLELKENAVKVYLLAQLAHEGMSRFLLPKLLPEILVGLSGREIEVLRWTSDGKTSTEVGEIMNLAKRTVDFHINCAMEKLGTCNKGAAAIKAVLLGLI